MLDTWNDLSLTVGDFVLGWLLRLPRDLTLAFVALFTALLMIGVRRFTTDQDLLRRAAEDNRRLKQLAREARRESDKKSLQRYKTTRSLIALIKLKAEGLPLLVSLLPIGLLATWALYRLEFLPVRAGETVELAVYTPVADAGEVIHVVPVDGVVADGGWVRQVEVVSEADEKPYGLATWRFRAEGKPEPYTLTFRVKDRSFNRELRVGQRIYAPPVVEHGDDYLSEWKYANEWHRAPYQWLAWIPGIPGVRTLDSFGLPAWLIGYIILVIPLTLVFKRLLNVY
jgi:uncharacterized membrane protein (DUF106 family)